MGASILGAYLVDIGTGTVTAVGRVVRIPVVWLVIKDGHVLVALLGQMQGRGQTKNTFACKSAIVGRQRKQPAIMETHLHQR